MKKNYTIKLVALMCCLCLSTSLAWSSTIATYFAGGTGTIQDPYQISNASELALLSKVIDESGESQVRPDQSAMPYDYLTSASYVLTQDVDLIDYENWKPIGLAFHKFFQGKFDGKGYTISNFQCNVNTNTGDLLVGLFGYIRKGEISNVYLRVKSFNVSNLQNITTSLVNYFGGFVGYLYESNITNCHVAFENDAVVLGKRLIFGGLVGYIDKSQARDCSVTGEVKFKADIRESQSHIAGLFGKIDLSTILNTYVNIAGIEVTKVNAYWSAFIGGLAGTCSDQSSLYNCYIVVPIIKSTSDAMINENSPSVGRIFELTYLIGPSTMVYLGQYGIQNCYAYDVEGERILCYNDNKVPNLNTWQNFTSPSTILESQHLYKYTDGGANWVYRSPLQAGSLLNALRAGEKVSGFKKNWVIKPEVNGGYPVFSDSTLVLAISKEEAVSDTTYMTLGLKQALPALNLTLPTKEGYAFTGYFTQESGGNKVIDSFGAFVTTDVADVISNGKWISLQAELVLYAQWEVKVGVDQAEITSLQVAFNSATGTLELSDMVDDVLVFDASGRLVAREQQVQQVDASQLSKGVYVVKMRYNNKAITHKFIK